MKATYGGTFDPPTNGHKSLIEKASNLFEKLIIVIAENPAKNVMFSVQERKEMLEAITKHLKNVEIVTLKNKFLVDFALENNCQFLVRGIRNNIDFSYEYDIYKTNRSITNKIETIFLMPDDINSVVSSSWVKNLMNCYDWQHGIVKKYVDPFVLNKLIEFEMHSIVKETSSKIQCKYGDALWGEVKKGYSKRTYHNYNHIIDGIGKFQQLFPQIFDKFYATHLILYAWLMHDIDDSIQKSLEIAKKYITFGLSNEEQLFDSLFYATDHTHNNINELSETASMFAIVDLLILSSTPEKYEIYRQQVFDEYFTKSNCQTKEEFFPLWREGRINFLQTMLKRDNIYGNEKFKNFSEDAIRNMKHELYTLNQGAE